MIENSSKNRKKAILFMLASASCFACMQTTVKLLPNMPTFEKVFMRNLVSLFIAFNMVKVEGSTFFGKKENRKYLWARSILGLLGVISYFYAIQNLVMADAAILNKLSPFFVTIFAVVFLNEDFTLRKGLSLVGVFLGALLVVKPQFSFDVIPALIGILSAAFAGAAYTLVRYLGNKERPATIVFFFSLVSVIGMFPFTIVDFVIPSGVEWIYFIGIGIFAAGGQFCLTYGYRLANASEVSIYDYFNIIVATFLGFLIWKEVPDLLSMFGMTIIFVVVFLEYIYRKRG